MGCGASNVAAKPVTGPMSKGPLSGGGGGGSQPRRAADNLPSLPVMGATVGSVVNNRAQSSVGGAPGDARVSAPPSTSSSSGIRLRPGGESLASSVVPLAPTGNSAGGSHLSHSTISNPDGKVVAISPSSARSGVPTRLPVMQQAYPHDHGRTSIPSLADSLPRGAAAPTTDVPISPQFNALADISASSSPAPPPTSAVPAVNTTHSAPQEAELVLSSCSDPNGLPRTDTSVPGKMGFETKNSFFAAESGVQVPMLHSAIFGTAGRSFRRQSHFGVSVSNTNNAVIASVPPRVRTKSIVPFRSGGSGNASFSSTVSDLHNPRGSGSPGRTHSNLYPSGNTILVGDCAVDLRNKSIIREEAIGCNAFRHTFLASEGEKSRRTYYVLKAVQNRFNPAVVPKIHATPPAATANEGHNHATGEPYQNNSEVIPSEPSSPRSPLGGLATVPLLMGLPAFHSAAPTSGEQVFSLDPRVSLCFTMLQKMGHKNMQTVFSAITIGTHALFLGEFFLNTNLNDDENNRADDMKVAQLAKEMLRALHYSHNHHIPHGHLTLNNIHLKDNGTSYAASDFGFAHLFKKLSNSQLWEAGYRDPALFPPERFANGAELQPAISQDSETDYGQDDIAPEQLRFEGADLWALGCSLYKWRFGRHPFIGDSVDELREKILKNEPDFPPWCDPNLEKFLRRLMHSDFDERGPFHQLLREPFLRQKVDLKNNSARALSSNSNSARETALGSGSNGFGAFLEVTHNRSSRHSSTRHSSGAGAAPRSPAMESNVSSAASSSVPVFLFCEDEVRCSHCDTLISMVCYQCQVCPEYHVCRGCYYQGSYHHNDDHELECHILDTAVGDDDTITSSPGIKPHSSSGQIGGSASKRSAAASSDNNPNSGSRMLGHRGTIMIPSSHLTERESMIFTMTGALPMCLDVERSMMAQSVRERHVQFVTNVNEGTPAVSHVGLGSLPFDEGIGSPSDTSMANKKATLATEATACEEETVELIIDNCIKSQGNELLLANMELDSIPLSMLDPPLQHVTVLDLANNLLTVIPDGIEYLVNLRRLLLGNNRLTELPDAIGNLTDLEFLDVNHNQLSTLPQTLMFCDQMDVLALDYNNFDEIPALLADVEIRNVYLAANPKIHQWPERSVLEAFPRGMTIGLDNEPRLFAAAPEALRGLEDVINVVWNKVFPDMILPDGLYLGSLRSAQSVEVYEKLNIQYLLTMGRGLDAVPPPGGKHKVVIVDDLPGASIDFSFQDAVEFIDEAMRSGSGCLVHCFAGMSRSATTVIAYLMMKRGIRLDEAYCTTRRGRPAIYPNAGFFDQLAALDAKLFAGQRPLDMASMEREKVP